MLMLENLSRRFGENTAVASANLEIPDGQMVGIIGRSGAGKSTLLKLLNRLTDPSDGKIVYAGTDIAQLKGRELREWRSDCAMIFQQFNLVGRLDVITNVLTGRLYTMPAWRSMTQTFTAHERAFAIQALDRLGMAHTALQRAETLSGGQQQRVAIARALAQEPKILLADEPIASLDPMNAKIVMDALRSINQQDGKTVICNLHTLDTARNYCDRIIGMSAGKIVFDGTPDLLTTDMAREIYGAEAEEFDEAATSTTLPDSEAVAALKEAAAHV
ncbi:phosphonate ABC transporter ATP-binding protein [Rhodobacteraceae bacterium N5(2021)]|uniref:Phosphonate ABC transporter ATP-binding protein n=1 Tax=Gymnodinialimonas phycosphaerae TaxID=2841589 RepID=A0A975TS46_9RHOB|nr:phosphonate ABC transporter ATP-binding protein [Gymnodinialimonas phycosphaerae]MBY4893498.1 phosphonate ABC transporter ATP-binding protein [Gymnodinialimonas phycosphaerae]